MSKIPKAASESAALDRPMLPVTDENDNIMEQQKPMSRQEHLPGPSPAPSLFTFKGNTSRSTWHRHHVDEEKYIRFVVEREGFAFGAIIADRIDPQLLFKVAPALRKRLEGRRIFIPSAESLNEEVIESMVYGLVRCAKEDIPIPEPAEMNPVTIIMMHCVMVFFEMRKEAEDLRAKLWVLLQQVKLTPMDVLWIWETFSGRVQSEPYTAPFASEYVQMMAWQILNLDAKGMLDRDIRNLIELEKEPKYLTETIETRFRVYGLGKDPLVSEAPKEVPMGSNTGTFVGKTANDVADGQKEKSMPPLAEQPGQGFAINQTKPNNSTSRKSLSDMKAPAFKSAGFTDVFKASLVSPAPFGVPDPPPTNVGPAASRFNFASASKALVVDPDMTWQSTAKVGAKQLGLSISNTGGEKQNNAGKTAPKLEVPTGFGFGRGGVGSSELTLSSSTTITPSKSPDGCIYPSPQPLFGGLAQPSSGPFTHVATQPAATSNEGRFAWGGPKSTHPTTNISTLNNNGLGTMSTFGPLNQQPSPQQPTGPVGGITIPTTGFQGPSLQDPPRDPGPNLFGTSASNAQSVGGFGTSSVSASNKTGVFGAPPNDTRNFRFPTNNASAFGAPSNDSASSVSNHPTPSAGFTANNFGGHLQQPDNNSFGKPFGATAVNIGVENNPFAFQGTPGGGGGNRNGASGSGMARRIAKPTGAKRFRK